jgi:predicted small secreted protein
MSNLSVKEVSKIVREYFDDIKKSKFIFDVISVDFDEEEEEWAMKCEISNVFDEEPRQYTVTVDDESGEIVDVYESE